MNLTAAMLSGALLVPLMVVALAALFAAVAGPRIPGLPLLFSRALSPTGWIGLPTLGAGLGALASLSRSGGAGALRIGALAVALCAVGSALVVRPPAALPGRGAPQTPRAKVREIRRAAFRSPATVATILPYTRDADPTVREQAVLALGVNMVVSSLERATNDQPSPYAALPVRDSLRTRLLDAMTDPSEGVRAEAARALWKAPAAFGRHHEAADTLAAVLDRALRPGAVERLSWLALDAAAGAPEPGLKAAAARFAAATPDTDLARAARLAARP